MTYAKLAFGLPGRLSMSRKVSFTLAMNERRLSQSPSPGVGPRCPTKLGRCRGRPLKLEELNDAQRRPLHASKIMCLGNRTDGRDR